MRHRTTMKCTVQIHANLDKNTEYSGTTADNALQVALRIFVSSSLLCTIGCRSPFYTKKGQKWEKTTVRRWHHFSSRLPQ